MEPLDFRSLDRKWPQMTLKQMLCFFGNKSSLLGYFRRCLRIVSSHKWGIWVILGPNRGSTFGVIRHDVLIAHLFTSMVVLSSLAILCYHHWKSLVIITGYHHSRVTRTKTKSNFVAPLPCGSILVSEEVMQIWKTPSFFSETFFSLEKYFNGKP